MEVRSSLQVVGGKSLIEDELRHSKISYFLRLQVMSLCKSVIINQRWSIKPLFTQSAVFNRIMTSVNGEDDIEFT